MTRRAAAFAEMIDQPMSDELTDSSAYELCLRSIERVLVLAASSDDAACREGLRRAYESVKAGGQQLQLTGGLRRHIQDAVRHVVTSWPPEAPADLYDALSDAAAGMALREWRMRWMNLAELPQVVELRPRDTTHFDAAAQADFGRLSRTISAVRRD